VPATLPIRVIPKAGRDEVAGFRAGGLLVRVTAAPESGKANAAACRVVADALGVPKTSVRVLRGETSRHKVLEIEGVTDARVAEVLGGERGGPRA
jgi:uncharacterized protein YggU (UPF0235/DUF167 family)